MIDQDLEMTNMLEVSQTLIFCFVFIF